MPTYPFRDRHIYLKIVKLHVQKNVCLLILMYIECIIKFRRKNMNPKSLKFLGKVI